VLPNNVLSTTVEAAPFIPPRNTVRFSFVAGQFDVHYGGIGIGNPSAGLSYQLWTAYSDGTNILLEAPNTPAFVELANVFPTWVALAFDQNARPFIAYTTANGSGFYYWFSTLANAFVTTQLPAGNYSRIFAALDDLRPANIGNSDIILAYTRGGQLYMRQERDRYGIEYDLATAPQALLVQIGMNINWRFQFGFQDVQGNQLLPPVEMAMPPGVNPPS
jgi:hypothetical protein